MRGTGKYDSSTGNFSGDLICDLSTVGSYCGNGHPYWCASSASCAWEAAYNSGVAGLYAIVGVLSIPVTTVTQQW